MEQKISLLTFCGRAIVDHIEDYTDLLKTLFSVAEGRNLGLWSDEYLNKGVMDEIDSYVSSHFDFYGDANEAIRSIFFDIYKVFVSGYESMELHNLNLDESDMDSTLCGIVRDYFHF